MIHILSFIIISLCSLHINAVSLCQGNWTTDNTRTFITRYNIANFHIPSQTIYFGLNQNAGQFSLSSLNTTTDGHCKGIALSPTGNATTTLNNVNVTNITFLTPTQTPSSPYIICTGNDGSDTQPTTLYAVNSDTLGVTESAAINDANAVQTISIIQLAASSEYAFAAVIDGNPQVNNTLPQTPQTAFGSNTHDGIALLSLNTTTQTLIPLDATTGLAGNKAFTLNGNSTALVLADTAPITFATSYEPCMCWNEKLQSLYIGIQATTNADGTTMSGVAIAKVDPLTHALSFVAPCAAAAINDDTRIIGTTGNSKNISIQNIAVMETSTGFFYLIVNGGNDTAANTARCVYAVPLVSGVTDNTLGTFAADIDNDYKVQATLAGDLLANTAPQAVVGSGTLVDDNAIRVANLPLEEGITKGVTNICVAGDTVFVSTNSNVVNENNAPGIYYSQAIFEGNGKIQGWTQWMQAAPQDSGTGNGDGSANFVAVNALNGRIFATDNAGTKVTVTTWHTHNTNNENALINILNKEFSDGCFSYYDMNQSLVNFATATTSRYALFGGKGKVAIALISTVNAASYDSPQVETTDFSQANNFKVTTLPNDTAPVTALYYSGWADDAADGFLCAGTKNGFYVYAHTDTGAGFRPDTPFGALNAAPFNDTFSWQKITNITGQVRAITGVGGTSSIYVLTKDIDGNGQPVDKVFQIRVGTTVANLNVLNTRLFTLATSSTFAVGSDLTHAQLFFDIAVIPNNENITDAALFLATSNGLYKSHPEIDDKDNQAEAGWSNMNTEGVPCDNIFTPAFTQYPRTFFATHWSDTLGKKTYSDATLFQYTYNNPSEVIPSSYITNATTKMPIFRSISAMMNDGTRRFMVMQPAEGDGTYNKLYMLPYVCDSLNWNYSAGLRGLEDNVVLKNVSIIYWIQLIGATGIIYAGTDKGVIALG